MIGESLDYYCTLPATSKDELSAHTIGWISNRLRCTGTVRLLTTSERDLLSFEIIRDERKKLDHYPHSRRTHTNSASSARCLVAKRTALDCSVSSAAVHPTPLATHRPTTTYLYRRLGLANADYACWYGYVDICMYSGRPSPPRVSGKGLGTHTRGESTYGVLTSLCTPTLGWVVCEEGVDND